MKVITANFRNSFYPYDYFTDLDLRTGDYVVVPTSPGYAVVKVIGVKRESNKATKWVVQKVDVEQYEERMKQYEENTVN